MGIQDMLDSPRKIGMLSGSLVFMLLFPLYFAWMPLADESLVSGGSGGQGEWLVSFSESEVIFEESTVLEDGDTHITEFIVGIEDLEEMEIGFVELEVQCNDNDDPGPGFSDSVEGVSDLMDVEGHDSGNIQDQSAEGECMGGNGGFTMRWDVTPNYTGESFSITSSQKTISETWNDGGFGIGIWSATLTAEVNSAPVVGQIVDSDEGFDIIWRMVTYEVIIEAPLADDP
ncbi:MAG: hypothetical protein CMA62_01175 [Euryarchaeota archaeon]|nr:hypothetical protein [Euryarchaeota archaeon]